jgi:hypothetical protein
MGNEDGRSREDGRGSGRRPLLQKKYKAIFFVMLK